jgi:hypothetical protein
MYCVALAAAITPKRQKSGRSVECLSSVVLLVELQELRDYVHRNGKDDGRVLLRTDRVQRLQIAQLKENSNLSNEESIELSHTLRYCVSFLIIGWTFGVVILPVEQKDSAK